MATRAKRDHYEVLGVNRDASANDLKNALNRKALQFRQEKEMGIPGATVRAAAAAEAYKVLSSPVRRGVYDKSGHQGMAEHTAALAQRTLRVGDHSMQNAVDVVEGFLLAVDILV